MIDLKRINGALSTKAAAGFTPETSLDKAVELIAISDVQNNLALEFLRHAQDCLSDEHNPVRIRAAMFEILLTAQFRLFPELLELLVEALPVAEEVLGEFSPIVIEGYKALAAAARDTTAKRGGGKPKALTAAKIALQRASSILGQNNSYVKSIEEMIDYLQRPLHKHSRFRYTIDRDFLFAATKLSD